MKADIVKLVCRNFRSYKVLVLNFSSKFVVFYGENGAGKTNILEAISLFSSERGLRKSPISDLNSLTSRPSSWNLDLVLEKNLYKTFLSTNVQNNRRAAKIDNSNVNSLSQFEEMLWILWIAPSMDNIFIETMSDRRSFFDHLVSGYDRYHKYRLKKLTALQKERLHVVFHRKDDSWLEILEKKISEESIKIIKSRYEFIDLLHETFEKYPSDFLRPKISVSGRMEEIYETNNEENAILEISYALKSNRFKDSEKQTTSLSVQKTFWKVEHIKTTLDAENCSTGEQKAFLISLILAVVRIYQDFRSGIPVLLLDDLMVHLDKFHRSSLIKELISINVQTFLTGTDFYFFEELSNVSQTYHVEKSICTLEKIGKGT